MGHNSNAFIAPPYQYLKFMTFLAEHNLGLFTLANEEIEIPCMNQLQSGLDHFPMKIPRHRPGSGSISAQGSSKLDSIVFSTNSVTFNRIVLMCVPKSHSL